VSNFNLPPSDPSNDPTDSKHPKHGLALVEADEREVASTHIRAIDTHVVAITELLITLDQIDELQESQQQLAQQLEFLSTERQSARNQHTELKLVVAALRADITKELQELAQDLTISFWTAQRLANTFNLNQPTLEDTICIDFTSWSPKQARDRLADYTRTLERQVQALWSELVWRVDKQIDIKAWKPFISQRAAQEEGLAEPLLQLQALTCAVESYHEKLRVPSKGELVIAKERLKLGQLSARFNTLGEQKERLTTASADTNTRLVSLSQAFRSPYVQLETSLRQLCQEMKALIRMCQIRPSPIRSEIDDSAQKNDVFNALLEPLANESPQAKRRFARTVVQDALVVSAYIDLTQGLDVFPAPKQQAYPPCASLDQLSTAPDMRDQTARSSRARRKASDGLSIEELLNRGFARKIIQYADRSQQQHDHSMVHTRYLIKRDFSNILQIERALGVDTWHEQDLRQALDQTSAIGTVAEVGSECVGYMVWTLGTDTIHLERFRVAPDRQRKGYGTALISHLLAKLEGGNINSIQLDVRDSNLAIHQFLFACGFRATEVLAGHFQNPHEDGYRFTITAQVLKEIKRHVGHILP
jgi:ribosomal-protein-alanine N-acetyltransferase